MKQIFGIGFHLFIQYRYSRPLVQTDTRSELGMKVLDPVETSLTFLLCIDLVGGESHFWWLNFMNIPQDRYRHEGRIL